MVIIFRIMWCSFIRISFKVYHLRKPQISISFLPYVKTMVLLNSKMKLPPVVTISIQVSIIIKINSSAIISWLNEQYKESCLCSSSRNNTNSRGRRWKMNRSRLRSSTPG